MRLMVVGAGASYAEALQAGLPEELRPPLMKDFATRLWRNYNPHFLLSEFLRQQGHDPGEDARAQFIALEQARAPEINVERFFEYAYNQRDLIVPGHEGFDPASEYENLLYHGILNPLVFLLVDGLFKHGIEKAPLSLSRIVAGNLRSGDTVLNLNYDTIFEIGAEQAGHELAFLPNRPTESSLIVSKPHGSMNLLVNKEQHSFYFARPLFAGSVQPADGAKNYIGIVPPRVNKQYAQHPVARMIIEATRGVRPAHAIFWGVGMTDSDQDLLDLYRQWCHAADQVDFINPSLADVENAKKLLGVDIRQYRDVKDWSSETNQDM